MSEFFDSRLQLLLPFIDTRSTTPGSDKSDRSRSAKRRKLQLANCKSTESNSCDASLDGMGKEELPHCDDNVQPSI